MQTKSKIQLIREAQDIADNYMAGLKNLMDKYTIEDSIFIHTSGMVYEATKGYFVEKLRCNSIEEAMQKWTEMVTYTNNLMDCGIRIINNKEFVVGEIKHHLVECDKESKIFDINRLTDIR